MTVHNSGQIVATGLPTLTKGPPVANIPGGILNAAAAKTADSIKEQAAHAKAAGAGMRGGGTPINVSRPPEGRTIPGVSFADQCDRPRLFVDCPPAPFGPGRWLASLAGVGLGRWSRVRR